MIKMAQEILLTAKTKMELEGELDYLSNQGKQEIKEKIQVALSFGDLSENSEYEEARNDQAKLEARIKEIEDILARAKVVDEENLSTEMVQIGSKVIIKQVETGMEFKIQILSFASTSKDKDNDFITSDDSPVAKAVMGHRAGDTVEVESPAGTVKYTIVEIMK